MGAQWSQLYPPAPTFTEKQLPDQTGRVFLVTGGYSGVGLELTRILFNAGGKVYVAGRSQDTAEAAINTLQQTSTPHTGSLHYLPIDLGDLSTIKPAAQHFLSLEPKLHILFHNAAISRPIHPISPQNHNLILATNALGPFLLNKLLLPALLTASSSSPPSSVRVIWTSSQYVDLAAPTNGPTVSDYTSPTLATDPDRAYMLSKTAHWYFASELGRRLATSHGILSLTQNPGNLRSNLFRNFEASFGKVGKAAFWVLMWPLLHEPRLGAYTVLFAGCSEALTVERDQGRYVVPWGRVHPGPREDLLNCLKSRDEGGEGAGRAEAVWEWCEEVTREWA